MGKLANMRQQVEYRLKRFSVSINRLRFLYRYGPALGVLLSYLSLGALGFFGNLPAPFGFVAVVVFYLGFSLALYMGPKLNQDKALKDETALFDEQYENTPAQFLNAKPVLHAGNDDARYLWREAMFQAWHEVLRKDHPQTTFYWRRADPLYFRYILPLILVCALLWNSQTAPQQILKGLNPFAHQLWETPPIQIDVWATPPAYTGMAPVYVSEMASDSIDLPIGTEVVFRVEGKGKPHLSLTREALTHKARLPKIAKGVFEHKYTISHDITAQIGNKSDYQVWDFKVIADDPPYAQFIEAAKLTEGDEITFKWQARDDYGVEALSLLVRRSDGVEGTPEYTNETLRLPVMGARDLEDETEINLIKHRWAGLPVELIIEARDAAGQTGQSRVSKLRLPEKLFLQPYAQAAQEVRRDVLRASASYGESAVSLTNDEVFSYGETELPMRVTTESPITDQAPEDILKAALKLDALTYEAEYVTALRDKTVFLGLRQAYNLLLEASSRDEAEGISEILWRIAVRVEHGDLANAALELAAAKQALERGLREGASDDELRRLMARFRQAVENYIAAKMAEALANGESVDEGDMREEMASMMGGNDLDAMLEALQDLTETGARDQARQLLNDLDQLLRNLEFQLGQNSGQGQGGSETMSKALEMLSDQLAEQRGLKDETFQQGEEPSDNGDNGAPASPGTSGQAGEGGENGASDGTGLNPDGDGSAQGLNGGREDAGRSLAERQRGLAEGLANAPGNLRAGATGEALRRAEEAQRRAADALEKGDGEGALQAQNEAIEALREAASALGDQIDAAGGEGDFRNPRNSDPFGRSSNGAPNGGENVDIPEESERRRAKEILDELRERLGREPTRQEEKEYLKRLLERF